MAAENYIFYISVRDETVFVFKGRGVFAKEMIRKGEFVLEYRGDLITKKDCDARMSFYKDTEQIFLFDFQWKGRYWWYVS